MATTASTAAPGGDAIAGDNAEICYRPDDIDVRFRTLSGTQIYYVPGVPNSPSAASISDRQFDAIDSFATATWRADPRHHTQFHIMLLDHSDDIELNHPESYGNDYIAGGAGEDEIFGQLGDDVIQGDGTIGLGASLPVRLSYADNLAAAQLSVTRSDGSKLAVTDFTAYDAWRNTVASGIGDLNVAASFEGLGDADDYIEGNGGRDVIFGNLGQDDILGGSSDLFGFTTAEMRPDGADLIFGGAGTDISRNNYGDATVDANGVVTVKPDGHALDADTIVGDNGRILRLVGVNGTVRGTGDYAPTAANALVASTGGLLNYAYDTEAIGTGAGYHHIVVRAVEHLDYTPGGILYDAAAASDRGGSDEIHGESGDDFIYGQLGHDIIFGEGQDDDIIGGTGNDWISGGTGNDGVIGDDGRIMTSRNSTIGEALNGVAGLKDKDTDLKNANGDVLDEFIKTPGSIQQATINISGQLKKSVNITPFSVDPDWAGQYDEFVTSGPKQNDPFEFFNNGHYSNDIIFGGLGSDWLHGGSGDDAILGGEALSGEGLDKAWTQVSKADGSLAGIERSDYARPFNPGDALRFNPDDVDGWHYDRLRRAGEFALYDEYDPLRKILLNADGSLNKDGTGLQWFLNFSTHEGVYVQAGTIDKATGQTPDSYPEAWNDGNDRIFGDLGNDWLVGGTGRDDIYGGFGNDLLNADDNQDTNGGANNAPDTQPSYEDRAYGGAGRDILIGNTGGDRLIDWVGEFNSYLVPFAPFGMATVSRTLQPQLAEFLYALSGSDGADPTRAADLSWTEAARNGEPAGELGVIRQKDYAWHDQTGAPTDPQAGNIPGGKRDVLRSATFNSGAPEALAADSGSWSAVNGTMQVAASSLHGDAVAVYQVGDALPGYYEVQATIQGFKPTSGWKANSYIIFDYQGETNFKFAGLDISNSKLVMGHRNATGWIVDEQASVKGGLKADTWYNMLLAVNGLTATLVIDNANVFSHTYAPTVVDGWNYGLNWGLVGFGSDNARGAIDNIAVQVLPPAVTLNTREDFGDATNILFAGGADVSGGSFAQSAGRYVASPAAGQTALSLANLQGLTQLAPASVLDLSATFSTTTQAGFVFDLYSPTDYKFVMLDVANKQVVIGHRQGNSWTADATVAKSLVAGTDYLLDVKLRGATVSVSVGGQVTAGFAYNGITIDGRFGLFAKGAAASFDSVGFKTNDPSFAPDTVITSTLMAAEAAGSGHLAASQSLTDARLAPLVDEAIRRWSLVEDAAFVEALRQVDIQVVDLEGLELGAYRDGVVYIDADAAGYGWFVDGTPRDDREFGLLRGPAAGRMDLLSVLAHELGHAGGLDHAGDGVMQATLAAGTRSVAPAEPPRGQHETLLPTFTVPSGGATSAAAPVIDWQAVFTPGERPLAGAKAPVDWLGDFVNHGAQSQQERNPNADLRVLIPVTARTSPQLETQAMADR